MTGGWPPLPASAAELARHPWLDRPEYIDEHGRGLIAALCERFGETEGKALFVEAIRSVGAPRITAAASPVVPRRRWPVTPELYLIPRRSPC